MTTYEGLGGKEPPWIEHDGSAVCPVPAGHDVEIKYRSGTVERSRQTHLKRVDWDHSYSEYRDCDITHYRDWTAFAQQEASGEVPEWAIWDAIRTFTAHHPTSGWTPEIVLRPTSGSEGFADVILRLARYIAAHEPAPVDPLRRFVTEIVEAAVSDIHLTDEAGIEHALEVAKAILPQAALDALGGG